MMGQELSRAASRIEAVAEYSDEQEGLQSCADHVLNSSLTASQWIGFPWTTRQDLEQVKRALPFVLA
jgi:hypothetical protein